MRPLAKPSRLYAVAKWSALPGVTSGGRRTKGTIFCWGRMQAVPVTASEAPSSVMKSRRGTPVELGGARRELALRRLGELGRALALLDAAPEARRLGSFGPVDDLETTRALAAALRFVVMVVAAHR
jgi:hypothetical protein